MGLNPKPWFDLFRIEMSVGHIGEGGTRWLMHVLFCVCVKVENCWGPWLKP